MHTHTSESTLSAVVLEASSRDELNEVARKSWQDPSCQAMTCGQRNCEGVGLQAVAISLVNCGHKRG